MEAAGAAYRDVLAIAQARGDQVGIGGVGTDSERWQHDAWVGQLREALDRATLEREWACGRAMTTEEAARKALDEGDG